MKVTRLSRMRVYEEAGESAVHYPHHEGAQFTATRLHEENNTALVTSQIWNAQMGKSIT